MLINPAGLYGGAAFRVDNTPLYNFAYRLQAKEQARLDSYDKYLKDLVNNTTDTGLRTQDIESFRGAIENAKKFYINNRDALVNRDPIVMERYQKLTKIPQIIASTSRNQFVTDQKIANLVSNDKEWVKNWTTKTKEDFDKSSAPVYVYDQNADEYVPNPNFAPFDIVKATTNPNQINLAESWTKIAKDLNINPDEVIVGTRPSKKRYHDIVQKQFVLSQDNAKKIGDYAKTIYDTDEASEYSFKVFTKNMTPQQMQADPNMAAKFNDLNETYKKAYGTDIQDEKDLFAAYAISQNETKNIKEEEKIDAVAWYNYTKGEDFRYSKKLAEYNKKLEARLKRQASPNINLATVKTAFEDIPPGKYGAFEKKGDFWYDANGNKLNSATNRFDVVIPAGMIPDGLKELIPASQRVALSKIRLNVVNGLVQGAIDDDPDNPIFSATSRNSLIEKELKKAGFKTAPATIEGGTAAPGTSNKYEGLD